MIRIPVVAFGLAAAIGGALLASCTTWKPVVLPNGDAGYTVDCSGSNLTWSHCYRKAGEACKHGYATVVKADNHGGKPVPGDLYGLVGGSVADRSLLIQCRDDPPPADTATTAPARDGAR